MKKHKASQASSAGDRQKRHPAQAGVAHVGLVARINDIQHPAQTSQDSTIRGYVRALRD